MGLFGEIDDMPEELKKMLIRKLQGEDVDPEEDFDDDEKEEIVKKALKGSEGQLKAGMIVKVYSGMRPDKRLENISLGKAQGNMILVKCMEMGRQAELWMGWRQEKPESIRMAWVHIEHRVATLPAENFEHQRDNIFGVPQGPMFDLVATMAKEANKQTLIRPLYQFTAAIQKAVKESILESLKEGDQKKV